MSAVVDIDSLVAPRRDAPKGRAVAKPAAAPVAKPAKPPVAEMSDGELADEHRGWTFAKLRAKGKLAEIEAELNRRKLVSAKGAIGFVSLQIADVGLVDLKRLRADLGVEICREYEIPGSNPFWRSGTLDQEERPCRNCT